MKKLLIRVVAFFRKEWFLFLSLVVISTIIIVFKLL